MTYEQMREEVKSQIQPKRYAHTLGVVDTAAHLAEIYGCDVTRARYAALLHDCAKSMPNEERIALCRENGVPIDEVEMENPTLLHAKCGAILAAQRYGITDREILHAIAVHTTGAPAMNLLDQIIFVADYIEPHRERAPHLDTLRQLAEENLEETVARILEDLVAYLRTRKDQRMDPTTLQAYHYYEERNHP